MSLLTRTLQIATNSLPESLAARFAKRNWWAGCLFGALWICTPTVRAEDWPGWRGEDRTGVSRETGLAKKWPKTGPKLLWNKSGIGSGYGTPAAVGGNVFVIGGKDGSEILFVLNAETGEQISEKPIGTIAGVGYAGPRSTPIIDGDRLFVTSSAGQLSCINRTDNEEIWRKDFRKDFGGEHGAWGFAESPLIDGDRVIVTPGGGSATMVALDKSTGNVLWKCAVAEGNTAAYSSAVVAMVGKKKQYVNFIHGALIGVDAETGKLAWSYEKSANGTANCSTAVAKDGYIFSASGYGTGGGLIKATAKGAAQEYFQNQFVNHHGGFVMVGKHIYGTNDQALLCMDFRTGKIVWKNRGVGKGSILAIGNLLVVRSEQGPVALVAASPQAYKELGRFDQPNRSNEAAWPYPVVSNGRLYLRDQDRLLAYEVGDAK